MHFSSVILIKYKQTKYFVILMFLQEMNYSMVRWAQEVSFYMC